MEAQQQESRLRWEQEVQQDSLGLLLASNLALSLCQPTCELAFFLSLSPSLPSFLPPPLPLSLSFKPASTLLRQVSVNTFSAAAQPVCELLLFTDVFMFISKKNGVDLNVSPSSGGCRYQDPTARSFACCALISVKLGLSCRVGDVLHHGCRQPEAEAETWPCLFSDHLC